MNAAKLEERNGVPDGAFLRGNLRASDGDPLRPFRFLPDHVLDRIVVLASLQRLTVRAWIIRALEREIEREQKRRPKNLKLKLR